MSEFTEQPHFYSNDFAAADLEFAHGHVSVRTLCSPTRQNGNEDAATVLPIDADTLVLGVADGVGGAPGGREAAAEAMRGLGAVRVDREHVDAPLRSAIIDAVEHANGELLRLARGSATTVAIVEIAGGQLRSYHVGDSEILVVGQRGRIKQRIVPHSPTGFAIEAGMLHEDDAMQHESRHILLNVVGSQGMRIEVGVPLKLAQHDTVLLASDGLWDNLYISEIVAAIRCGPLPQAANKLVALSSARMASTEPGAPSKPDDLTIILYRQRDQRRGTTDGT